MTDIDEYRIALKQLTDANEMLDEIIAHLLIDILDELRQARQDGKERQSQQAQQAPPAPPDSNTNPKSKSKSNPMDVPA